MTLFTSAIECRLTISLVRLWLNGFGRNGRGLPQGSPLSPLLSNLALSPVDRAIDGKTVRLVRYADDFLLMTRKRPQAEAAALRLAGLLEPLGLVLNSEKTRVASLDEGIKFLGYWFKRDRLKRVEGTQAAA